MQLMPENVLEYAQPDRQQVKSILLVHNRYKERGGEDVIMEREAELLEQHGHRVSRLFFDNHSITNRRSPWASVRLAASTIWSREAAAQVQATVRDIRPDIVHFHNTFPRVSPAAYAACKNEGSAVVQTLHNYRLLCANGLFFRDGHPCEDCLGRIPPWPSVLHSCYRGSRTATAVTAAMLTVHHTLGTWRDMVDVFVALTEFARHKFIEGGLPAEKLIVKPNFVHPDPGFGDGKRQYALFVGRLSPEKGIDVLLRTWERLNGRIPLKIAGTGPLANRVIAATQRIPEIEYLGQRSTQEIYTLMQQAMFLVVPSEWYEGMPCTIVEAFSTGTPVLASNLGAMSTVVQDGSTGLHFAPGNVDDLVAKVEWMREHAVARMQMGRTARATFEANYTAERTYQRLMEIYTQARHAHGLNAIDLEEQIINARE